ncbi:hypothetical protein, partial [Paenibacillus plantarum]|uniref:hypothetical protein n=1 Tax=Paenibacillus plantarum TaxID=2654975 RepID=UPI001491BE21
ALASAGVVAKNTGNAVGANAGDTIEFTFDTPTNGATIPFANILVGGATGKLGTTLNPQWDLTKTKLTVTLGVSSAVYLGDTLTIDLTGVTLTNIGGEGLVGTNPSQAISSTSPSTFGAGVIPALNGTTPVVTPYGSNDYRGQTATQYFDLKFANATNKVLGNISTGNVTVKDGTNTVVALGTGSSAEWQDSQTLRITIGVNSVIEKGNFTVHYDAVTDGLKDFSHELNAAGEITQSLANVSFGTKVPGIDAAASTGHTGIEAFATGSSVGADEDDTITIYLDTPTDQLIDISDITVQKA